MCNTTVSRLCLKKPLSFCNELLYLNTLWHREIHLPYDKICITIQTIRFDTYRDTLDVSYMSWYLNSQQFNNMHIPDVMNFSIESKMFNYLDEFTDLLTFIAFCRRIWEGSQICMCFPIEISVQNSACMYRHSIREQLSISVVLKNPKCYHNWHYCIQEKDPNWFWGQKVKDHDH